MVKLLEQSNVRAAPEPYIDNVEHLSDELELLNLEIKLRLLRDMERKNVPPFKPLTDMYISLEDMVGLLTDYDHPLQDPPQCPASSEQEKVLLSQIKFLYSHISGRRRNSQNAGIILSLVHLSNLFGLSKFEERCIILGLASQLERKYEKLYAYLQDDPNLDKPTVELAVILLCKSKADILPARQSFDQDAPLIRYGFLRLIDSRSRGEGSLLAREIVLDERIVQFLLGAQKPDQRLLEFAKLVENPLPDHDLLSMLQEERGQIVAWLRSRMNSVSTELEGTVINLTADCNISVEALVEGVSQDLKRSILFIDSQKLHESDIPFPELGMALVREVILQDAVLCVLAGEQLFPDPRQAGARGEWILEQIAEHGMIAFIVTRQPVTLGKTAKRLFVKNLSLESRKVPLAAWEQLGKRYGLKGSCDLETISEQYRLPPWLIHKVLQDAEQLARWRSPDDGGITELDLMTCCGELTAKLYSNLAMPINNKREWNNLVLPPDKLNQLQAIIQQIRNRKLVLNDWGFEQRLYAGKGMHVLFTGPSGTGKTMAAEVVANELGFELYRVELSQVIGNEAADTIKNFRQLFEIAQSTRTILLFDEANALFGQSSDNGYLYAASANLLQQLTEFEGLSIITTSISTLSDKEFSRYFQAHVQFTCPETAERERLWRSMIPVNAPVGEIDFSYLARNFKLTGGELRDVVYQAAYLAAGEQREIGMSQTVRALNYILQKQGKPCLPSDFGMYEHYVKLVTNADQQ